MTGKHTNLIIIILERLLHLFVEVVVVEYNLTFCGKIWE